MRKVLVDMRVSLTDLACAVCMLVMTGVVVVMVFNKLMNGGF